MLRDRVCEEEMRKSNLIFILSSIFLSGCANYNSQFDCPAGQGVGCKSIEEIDKLIEAQELPKQEEKISQDKKPVPRKLSQEKTSRPRNREAYQGVYLNRLPETIQKVLLAGYEDDEGNFYGPQYVYLLVEESKWEGY